jgi:hypothetical protein
MGNRERPQPYTFEPELDTRHRERLEKVTDRLLIHPRTEDQEFLLTDEIQRVQKPSIEAMDEEELRYLATLEVLHDLIEIGYEVQKNGTIQLVPPAAANGHRNGEKKERERKVLQKERKAQFREDSVQQFIRQMESDEDGESILSLLTAGEELHKQLVSLQTDGEGGLNAEQMRTVIDPYIQAAEKGENCPFIGLDLMDIWRYFRYTWLTPYRTVPGRNINLLVRNAALPKDPVIGIASIASPMMNLKPRDEHIGWTVDAIEQELERWKRIHKYEEELPVEERTPQQKTRTVRRTEWLESVEEWEQRTRRLAEELQLTLKRKLEEAIEHIRFDDLLEDRHLDDHGLPRRDLATYDRLYDHEERAKQKEREEGNSRREDEDWEERSQTPLFVKKRARTLRQLVDAYEYFEEHDEVQAKEFLENALSSKKGESAINRGLKEVKKERLSSGIMNVMVCGAIPPYSYLTGGKLVAMASTGPEVINLYKEKYQDYESQIASSLKGEPVVRRDEIVWFETTSLFEAGSSQYSRVRLPTAEGGLTEFREVGTTEGYGSIQFGPETREVLTEVVRRGADRAASDQFGSGVAPRMRKIRQGLEHLGLDGGLLHHDSRRIVYGVETASNAVEYLRGFEDEPDYHWDLSEAESAQNAIHDHWLERWASMRAEKEGVLEKIGPFDASELLLSGELPGEKEGRS